MLPGPKAVIGLHSKMSYTRLVATSQLKVVGRCGVSLDLGAPLDAQLTSLANIQLKRHDAMLPLITAHSDLKPMTSSSIPQPDGNIHLLRV